MRSLGSGAVQGCAELVQETASQEGERTLRSGKVSEDQVERIVAAGLECGADAYCAANFGIPPGICSGLVSHLAGPLVSFAVDAVQTVGEFVGFGRQAQADRDYEHMQATDQITAASKAQIAEIKRLAIDSITKVSVNLAAAGQGLPGVTTGSISTRLGALGVTTGFNGYNTIFDRVADEAYWKVCNIPATPPPYRGACMDTRVDWKKREGFIRRAHVAAAQAATDYYADWANRLRAAAMLVAGEIAAERARIEAERLMREQQFKAARERYATALAQYATARKRNNVRNAVVAAAGAAALGAALWL